MERIDLLTLDVGRLLGNDTTDVTIESKTVEINNLR
jgi:hypothetical protein